MKSASLGALVLCFAACGGGDDNRGSDEPFEFSELRVGGSIRNPLPQDFARRV